MYDFDLFLLLKTRRSGIFLLWISEKSLKVVIRSGDEKPTILIIFIRKFTYFYLFFSRKNTLILSFLLWILLGKPKNVDFWQNVSNDATTDKYRRKRTQYMLCMFTGNIPILFIP